MQVSTTLKETDGQRFVRRPYMFGSEQEKSAWIQEFDSLMAEFYCEIRVAYASMEPLIVYYEEDVPIIHAVLPEAPGYLAWVIRNRWYAGELDLNRTISVAA